MRGIQLGLDGSVSMCWRAGAESVQICQGPAHGDAPFCKAVICEHWAPRVDLQGEFRAHFRRMGPEGFMAGKVLTGVANRLPRVQVPLGVPRRSGVLDSLRGMFGGGLPSLLQLW